MFEPVRQNNTTQRDDSSNSNNERERDADTDDQVEIFEDAPDGENWYYICLYTDGKKKRMVNILCDLILFIRMFFSILIYKDKNTNLINIFH